MKSLIYVGMDVHKESYSVCCYLISSGEFVGETKMEANPLLIKKYLLEMEKLLKEANPHSRLATVPSSTTSG